MLRATTVEWRERRRDHVQVRLIEPLASQPGHCGIVRVAIPGVDADVSARASIKKLYRSTLALLHTINEA